ELRDAAGRSGEQSVPGAAGRGIVLVSSSLLPQCANDAAVLALHLEKTGHRRPQRQLLGVGCVDPAHQRLDQSLERLASKAAAYKMRQAFVGGWRTPRHEVFEGHAQLAGPTEKARAHNGPHVDRCEQLKTLGNRKWFSLPQNERTAIA